MDDARRAAHAQVTRPGEEGRCHVVTGIYASYNQRHAGLLTLQDGGHPPKRWFCRDQRDLLFTGLHLLPGNALQVTLAMGAEARSDDLAVYLVVVGYMIPAGG